MAIPSSGQVSIGTIRTELQNTGTNNFALSRAGSQRDVRNAGYTPLNQSSTSLPGATAPYAVSEWRNYNHSATRLCGSATFGTPLIQDVAPGAAYTYYAVTVTGAAGWDAQYGIEGLLIGSTQEIRVNIYQSYPFSSTGAITGTPAAVASITFDGSAGASQSQAVSIPMLSSSEVHHIIIWDGSIL
jgi:hypothetical protein